jgi:hypothetical protein
MPGQRAADQLEAFRRSCRTERRCQERRLTSP